MTDHAALADVIFDAVERWNDEGKWAAAIVAAVNEGRIPPIVPENDEPDDVLITAPNRPEYALTSAAELASLRALKAKVDGLSVSKPNGHDWVLNVLSADGKVDFRYASPLLAWLREPTGGEE